MILTERDIYPRLEFDRNSKHDFTIQLFFDEIKEFSLCWLAEEELEHKYPNRVINKELKYRRNGNMIEILEKKSKSNIAQIRYIPL
ncbi:hypothetical protein JMN32_07745 [Fulvivirga sp. 29W222]|uniref:Uncharacterized protein n=1 Tax=Fulvivirga marina TaxID=2494733 RepID=A0A937FXF7_9BACT|nr:hypothetical protein [Fulvivirga marina]MBL6446196.1 hypothetical protein [Fulvivirga marina]